MLLLRLLLVLLVLAVEEVRVNGVMVPRKGRQR